MKDKDTLRTEHPAELGQREKYVQAYREGTHLVIIAPDLRKLFPDSDAVNRALRKHAEEHRMRQEADSEATDWDKIDALTDEELTRAALSDPDNPPLDEEAVSRMRPAAQRHAGSGAHHAESQP